MEMVNILVTGGAGYIGSHACKALRKIGYNPICFDNLSTGWHDAVLFGPFVQGDLRNIDEIDMVFETYKPTAVMHFAALSQVGESCSKPDVYWNNNFVGSMNLINAAVKYNCKNFIFSSTCATYGDGHVETLREDTIQVPNNAYGASKLATEHLLAHYRESFGLKSVIFRYFNVAGADPDGEIGECHRPETHLIPLLIEAADNNAKPFTIFGEDYNTPDGTCVRDFLHVSDLVDAHLLGLKRLEEKQRGGIYNLGTGIGFSVREVITQIETVTGNKVLHEIGHRREGDAAILVSGSELATSELGWQYPRSNLDQMISDAWRWYKCGKYIK